MNAEVCARLRISAFRRNLQAIRRQLPPTTRLCPAVKANAYGHGIDLLLPALSAEGIRALAVAQLEEALTLRRLGWHGRILCLGAPVAGEDDADGRERARAALSAGVECTVTSEYELGLLCEAAAALDCPARVQIKVDTGMGRMGVRCEDAPAFVVATSRRPAVRITGIYTHFATADEPDLSFAQQQLDALLSLREQLRTTSCRVGGFHAANSAGIFCLSAACLDMVRPGLAIYGYWGGDPDSRPSGLQPILRVTSRIIALRHLPAGCSIGYGRTFRTTRDSAIAVLPIGYADGFRRALSNAASITVEARRSCPAARAPVVGRVSMDTISVDVTGLPDVRVGDAVTIVDDDPAAPNSVEAIARQLGTIPYEVTCALGPRVKRVVDVDEAAGEGCS